MTHPLEFVLVPRERVSLAMVHAARKAFRESGEDWAAIYRAMLSAAPPAPMPTVEEIARVIEGAIAECMTRDWDDAAHDAAKLIITLIKDRTGNG